MNQGTLSRRRKRSGTARSGAISGTLGMKTRTNGTSLMTEPIWKPSLED